MKTFKAMSRKLLCSKNKLMAHFVEVTEDGESYLVERRFLERARQEISKKPAEPSRIIRPAGVTL